MDASGQSRWPLHSRQIPDRTWLFYSFSRAIVSSGVLQALPPSRSRIPSFIRNNSLLALEKGTFTIVLRAFYQQRNSVAFQLHTLDNLTMIHYIFWSISAFAFFFHIKHLRNSNHKVKAKKKKK